MTIVLRSPVMRPPIVCLIVASVLCGTLIPDTRPAAAEPLPVPALSLVAVLDLPPPLTDDYPLADAIWVAQAHQVWLAADAERIRSEQAERARVAEQAQRDADAAKAQVNAASTLRIAPAWLHGWITDAILAELKMCESTNNYGINSGNGFYGAVQWLRSTWNIAAVRAGRHDLVGISPEHVLPADQDYVTRVWWSEADYRTQWPVCGPRAVARAG
jgi:hypothetical protein